jgi:hypothetical protein
LKKLPARNESCFVRLEGPRGRRKLRAGRPTALPCHGYGERYDRAAETATAGERGKVREDAGPQRMTQTEA